jgi:hypothetical protein
MQSKRAVADRLPDRLALALTSVTPPRRLMTTEPGEPA